MQRCRGIPRLRFFTRSKTYEKTDKTRKNSIFGFFGHAPAKKLDLTLERSKIVENWPISRIFSTKLVSIMCSKDAVEKTGPLKKKIREKTWVQSDFMAILLKKFLKKKSEKKILVQNFFFSKVVHSTPKRRQKKIFF